MSKKPNSDIVKLLNDTERVQRIQKIIEGAATIEEAVKQIEAEEIQKLHAYQPVECSYDCSYCDEGDDDDDDYY